MEDQDGTVNIPQYVNDPTRNAVPPQEHFDIAPVVAQQFECQDEMDIVIVHVGFYMKTHV